MLLNSNFDNQLKDKLGIKNVGCDQCLNVLNYEKIMLTRLETLQEYYDLLGCKVPYKINLVNCEICENEDFKLVCSHTDTGNNILAPVPVRICERCGFLMQNPRFEDEFYKKYYVEFYPYMRARSQSNKESDPTNVSGKPQMNSDGTPNNFGFNVALERAEHFYKYLQKLNLDIPSKTLLDVGCGCGGFLEYFNSVGYRTKGNDPDEKSAKFAITKGLDVDILPAEEMEYNEKYGLIIIIGSLEHCRDPNIVLKKCWEFLEDGGVLVIEGRYYPISESFRWLNSNHHRFFTHQSAQAMFIKHGFQIIKSTKDPVSGSNTGRNGGGFCFGRKDISAQRYINGGDDNKNLITKLNELGLIQDVDDFLDRLKNHDENFDIKYS